MGSPSPGPHTQLPWELCVSTAGTVGRLSGHNCPISGQPWCTPESGPAVFSAALTTELGETGGYLKGFRGREGKLGWDPCHPRAGGSRSERVREVWGSVPLKARAEVHLGAWD